MKNNTIRKQLSNLMTLAAGLSLTIAVPTTTDAAAYMKFDGIDGESQDDKHKDWIDVLSIDWGMHKPGGGATGQSRRRGAVIIEDVIVSKELDKSSPKLQEACLTGKVIPKLEIELTASYGDGAAGEEQREQVYLTIELTNVLITSTKFHFQAGATGATEQLPTEDFSLNFEEIKVTYTEYDKNGSKKGNVEYSWKVEEGEAG